MWQVIQHGGVKVDGVRLWWLDGGVVGHYLERVGFLAEHGISCGTGMVCFVGDKDTPSYTDDRSTRYVGL